jgi:hypothetical protein
MLHARRLAEIMGERSVEAALQRAAKAMGLPAPGEAYGCGMNGCAAPIGDGCAAPIGDGRVLKITVDPFETALVEQAIKDGVFDGFARVYAGPTPLWMGERMTLIGPIHQMVMGYVREDLEPHPFYEDDPEYKVLQTLTVAANDHKGSAFARALPRLAKHLPGIAAFARRLYDKGMLLADTNVGNIGARREGPYDTYVLYDARVVPRRSGRRKNPLTPATALAYWASGRDGPFDLLDPDGMPGPLSARNLASVVRKAEELLQVEVDDTLLGCGLNGCVLPVRAFQGRPVQGFVLKVTGNTTEVAVVRLARALFADEGFVRIATEPVELGRVTDTVDPFYGYVREEIVPLDEPMQRVLGDLQKDLARANSAAERLDLRGYLRALKALAVPHAFLRPIASTLKKLAGEGVLVSDIWADNMGRRADGTLVLVDAEGNFLAR